MDKGEQENSGEGRRTRRLLPFGLIAFIVVCCAMMVALVYYVWKLIDGL